MELKEFKACELEDMPELNLIDFYWNCYQNIKVFRTLANQMNVLPEDRTEIKDEMAEFEGYCFELCQTLENSVYAKEELDEDMRASRPICQLNILGRRY